MRLYNEDDRSCKMSDLAQENKIMNRALYEVIENYIALEGFKLETPCEVYLYKKLRESYLIAAKAFQTLP